jgi:hypothetical protein
MTAYLKTTNTVKSNTKMQKKENECEQNKVTSPYKRCPAADTDVLICWRATDEAIEYRCIRFMKGKCYSPNQKLCYGKIDYNASITEETVHDYIPG